MAKIRQKPAISHLHRLIGQLQSIEHLIEQENKICKVLQQIEAVRGSLKSLEKRLIESKTKKIKDSEVKDCFDYLCKID